MGHKTWPVSSKSGCSRKARGFTPRIALLSPAARWMMLAMVASLASWGIAAAAQPTTPDALGAKAGAIVRDALAKTGVPSASVALVRHHEIVWTEAFGNAVVDSAKPARPEMRYSIGSISKQFTAAALLLLAEEGKLSIDDRVAKYVPNVTRANEVTIRQLLSHTSGYQDYWPQDYVPPFMRRDITAQQILDRWARIPLDFEPGTKWQYSNTNYVIAGLIIEKVSSQPLLAFLQQRIFSPLAMKSVLDTDRGRLGDTDATGYLRYALGPARAAPKEGKGWMFAAGELAMTASDLARWDIGLLQQKVLRPESLRELTRDQLLVNGTSTRYGLGVQLGVIAGHRVWRHGGEVSGFTADNVVLPDDDAAVVVLVNQDNSGAASIISNQLAPLLFVPAASMAADTTARDRGIFEALQAGKLDRSLFTENGNSYFTEQAVADFASSLAPLGKPTEFRLGNQSLRGGMTTRVYTIKAGGRTLQLVLREMPDGKIEQYQISAAE